MSPGLAAPASSPEAWETDDDRNTPILPALRSPMETRSSGRNARPPSWGSKKSRRSVTPPGRMGRSPPVPGSDKTDKSDRSTRDMATDEKISILDPRRFTPTLHANLVGEILSLKRDQEEKRRVIEGLESQLETTREEEDGIHESLQTTARENRSLKRQLALLEGGSSSALSSLTRERDEAVEVAVDSKRRLEAAQKKLKTQEDSASHARGAWENEKHEWEEEKRKSDRTIHILEIRLKAVLEEVAAYQMAIINQSGEATTEDDLDDKARDSDAGSIRSMGKRFSVMPKPNGFSLADELGFDDESDGGTETNNRDSVMSTYMLMRNDSRAGVRVKFHRHQNSVESLARHGSVTRGRLQSLQEGNLANRIIQEGEESPAPAQPKLSYVDAGVQFSPPPSPKVMASKASAAELRGVTALAAKWERQQHEETSTEANSRRKRISIAKPLVIQAPVPAHKLMVSSAVQTADVLMTPPRTPRSPIQEEPIHPETNKLPDMVSSGTQTERPASPRPVTPDAIPSIAVYAPTSGPPTPRQPPLAQLQRDFGCQVSLPAIAMVSSGIQTEEIRVDQRVDRLPPHLRPSAVNSRPVSPAATAQRKAQSDVQSTPVPGSIPARNPKRLTSQSSSSIRSASPRGSMELDSTDRTTSPSIGSRKPTVRPSGPFTAFHDVSSGDEMDDFGDAESDSEFTTALSAPRAVKSPDPTSMPSSPETVIARKSSGGDTPASPLGTTNIYNAYRLSGNQGVAMPDRNSSMKSGLRPSAMSSSGADSMRRSTLIQNGINTHRDDAADPPFPIPNRASSRQPVCIADMLVGADNRSPTRNEPLHRRGMRTAMYRSCSIRKNRSGAMIAHGKSRHRKRGSGSPSHQVASTPQTAPLPGNALATPRKDRSRSRGHRYQKSGTTEATEATTGVPSPASSQTASGVIDAIAQTMVGEWMFKYVRRRKSFGLGGDKDARDDSSNDRHKRWVWLAPYERSILWSSKQPSSGTALLGGKSGRKLVIQSVLDVKDDNPAPKGSLGVFNRSILILTPQRALKFTAINADRHYLWLTALSFLAHSQQEIPDMPPATVTPKQHQAQPGPDYAPSPPRHGRARIRDSIRLAKAHNPTLSPSQPVAPAEPQHRDFSDGTLVQRHSIPDVPTIYRSNSAQSEDEDSAEPPVVPRFGRDQAPVTQFHGRKRSNTGGRVPPPLSFRGLPGGSANAAARGYGHGAMDSQSTAGLSDVPLSGGPRTPGFAEATWSEIDRTESRTSMVSASNLFEAIGTMRMEAFISPLAYSRFEAESNYPEVVRKRNKEMRRQKSRSRSRSKTRGEGVVRGGVAGWKEEYMSSYGGGTAGGAGGRGRRDGKRESKRESRRDSRYGGMGRENGYRTAGEEERGRGRRDPFDGF